MACQAGLSARLFRQTFVQAGEYVAIAASTTGTGAAGLRDAIHIDDPPIDEFFDLRMSRATAWANDILFSVGFVVAHGEVIKGLQVE